MREFGFSEGGILIELRIATMKVVRFLILTIFGFDSKFELSGSIHHIFALNLSAVKLIEHRYQKKSFHPDW